MEDKVKSNLMSNAMEEAYKGLFPGDENMKLIQLAKIHKTTKTELSN